MGTIEEELKDTKTLLEIWRREGAGKVVLTHGARMDLATFAWDNSGRAAVARHTFNLHTCEYQFDKRSTTTTIRAGSKRLAGMFLAEAAPTHYLINTGLKIAKLSARLEELFPTLDWTIYQGEKIRFIVDPLTRSYAERVLPELPWTFHYAVGYLVFSGFTPYCEGAFLWKTAKIS